MSFTSQCPECGKSLRIPDEKAGAMVKCRTCGVKFRAAVESDEDVDLPPPRSRKSSRKKSAASGALQPFLRRWLIAVGVVLALTLILGIVGLSSEILALTASMVCVVTIIGCLLTGTIWMVIDLAKEDGKAALLAALMPPAGAMMSFQRKSPARRGAIVFVSMVAPTLLLGLMLLFFLPKYTGAGKRGVQTAKWEDLMRQMDSKVTPETPVVTVTVRVASNPGGLDGIEPRCEALLRPHKSYVHGSLKIDAGARLITYQYRGHENFNQMIAFYLGSSTGVFTPQGTVKPDGT